MKNDPTRNISPSLPSVSEQKPTVSALPEALVAPLEDTKDPGAGTGEQGTGNNPGTEDPKEKKAEAGWVDVIPSTAQKRLHAEDEPAAEPKSQPIVPPARGTTIETHITKHDDKKKRVTPLISAHMVSKSYGDDPLDYKTLVLKNVYLEIIEGEFLIVFGPSGSGKSTLLNMMAGLEMPTGGKVMIRKRNIAQFSSNELATYHRLRMGMVFQNFNLIKSLNVWENVALPQTASGVRYALRKRRALHLLKLLHIDHYANRHPNELSGGEQQRVAIARAMINNPYFLLVDEPTGNLDTKSAEDVMHLLYDLNLHAHHTIVLVTHNPAHLRYATRVVYIEDGKIIIEEKRERSLDLPKKLEDHDYKRLSEYKGTA